MISVYTPIGKVVKQMFDLAPRVPTLDGLVLGILDNNKWNAQKLLRQLETEFRARYSLKDVIYVRKPYFSRPAFPDMITGQTIADAVAALGSLNIIAGELDH